MLSRFFLDRPVFAWVIAIVMMLVGALAIHNLPIAQYPPIAPPSISIRASYPGASAQTVEDSVVQIIETSLTGLDRMLYMHSTADASGSGAVELTFAPGTDPDIAWSKVQNKLQLAMPALPDTVQKQGVTVSKSTRNFLVIVGLVSIPNPAAMDVPWSRMAANRARDAAETRAPNRNACCETDMRFSSGLGAAQSPLGWGIAESSDRGRPGESRQYTAQMLDVW